MMVVVRMNEGIVQLWQFQAILLGMRGNKAMCIESEYSKIPEDNEYIFIYDIYDTYKDKYISVKIIFWNFAK